MTGLAHMGRIVTMATVVVMALPGGAHAQPVDHLMAATSRSISAESMVDEAIGSLKPSMQAAIKDQNGKAYVLPKVQALIVKTLIGHMSPEEMEAFATNFENPLLMSGFTKMDAGQNVNEEESRAIKSFDETEINKTARQHFDAAQTDFEKQVEQVFSEFIDLAANWKIPKQVQ